MALDKVTTAFNTFVDTKYVGLKTQPKLLVWGAALAVPVIAFMFLYVSPKNKEIATLRQTKEGLEQEIKKAEAVAAHLDEHRAEKEKTEQNFAQASRLLRQKKEIPSLLTNISSQGSASGLDFLSFKPGAERMQDFYAEIPVDITVNGPYHNVGLFLDKVSKLDRIVTASDLAMGTPKVEGGEVQLSTKLSLVTYRFLEPGEAAKASGAAAATGTKKGRR